MIINGARPQLKTSVAPIDGPGAYLIPILMLLFSLVVVGWLTYHPQQSKPVLVLFAPGTSSTQTISSVIKAGAHIVGLGAYPNSLIVQSNQPDFFDHLRDVGAWFIADAKGAVSCHSSTSEKQ